MVLERLDRALVSTDWVVVFPLVKLHHSSNLVSDHSILVLKETSLPRQQRQQPRLFRFKSMWLADERCNNVVEEAWKRGGNSHAQWPFEACLEECQTSVKAWNKNNFGHVGTMLLKALSALKRKGLLEPRRKAQTCLIDVWRTFKKKLIN